MRDEGRPDEGILPGHYVEGGEDPGYEGAEGYEDAGYEGYEDGGYEDEDYGDAGYQETVVYVDEHGRPVDADGYPLEAVDHDDGADYDDGVGRGYPETTGGDGRNRRPSRSPRVQRRRRVVSVIAGVLAVLVVVAGVALIEALHQINPGGKLGRAVTVTIPSGSSTSRIASILAGHGVIHDATLFRFYVDIEGDGPLLAGTYRLPTNEPYSRVINVLQKGAVTPVDKLVIPEGFTLEDIAARIAALPGMHISAASFLAVSSSGSVRSPYERAGVNDLEGLVFPATYDIARTDTAADIMQELVDTFDQNVSGLHVRTAAKALGMTPYQVVTVASIVEGEAKFANQYPDTASVIYNRLKSGMTLGADSTLIYALRQKDPGVDINRIDYEQPNPYNTRLHTGLPPTPIDSPSLPALEAALHPPTTTLEYFVEINPDGELGFASTSAGFSQLEAECQQAKLGC